MKQVPIPSCDSVVDAGSFSPVGEIDLTKSQIHLEAAALRALAEASDSLWQARDLGAGLKEILAASIRLMGADKGNIQILDADGVLRIRAHDGFDDDFLSFFREVRTDDNSACGKALRDRKSIFIPDVDLDAEYQPYVEAAHRAGYRAVISCPIVSFRGDILGMLSTHFAEPRGIGSEALDVFQLYAKLAASFMERMRYENHIKFLNAEMNHRAKNLLAVVHGIAYASVPEPGRTAFLARLDALAKIQDLTVHPGSEQIELQPLAEKQLASFMHQGRVTLEGPKVMLSATDARALGIVLHELATNSIKYGALSNGHGMVSFRWSADSSPAGERDVTMRWVEAGGPPVRAPERKGFGTKVLESFADRGGTKLEFLPEGFRWQASCRISPPQA